MQESGIVRVTPQDVAQLEGALRQLADDLGDAYRAETADLAAAVCGPGAECLAMLARSKGRAVGAVLATPVFSTILGGMGLFVSDLWVAPEVRGRGLARALLARTLAEAAGARFLKLTVYEDNPNARAVYDKLGFEARAGECNMSLTGQPLETLREKP